MRASDAPDVIVVGGGLHGCSTALHLARAGARVTVVEKDTVGRHASGANAGGVRQLARQKAEIPLSVAAAALWQRIEDLVDDDCGFERTGQVMVAEDEAELERLGGRAAEVRALGFAHEELVDRAELKRLVPAIADHCVGALIVRDDGAADPFRTVTAFRRKGERLGVRFAEGAAARRIVRETGAWTVETADGGRHAAAMIVNCAGAWGDRIAAMIGDRVPLAPIAPMLMITARLPPLIRPVVISIRRTLSLKQLRNGTVLIGGGHRGRALPDDNRADVDIHKLAISAGTVGDLFPALRGATIVRSWAAIEALTPDEIPVIGPSAAAEGAFHAFGFSAHGFQLGPIVGRIIADLATRGTTDMPIAPFAADRFASRV